MLSRCIHWGDNSICIFIVGFSNVTVFLEKCGPINNFTYLHYFQHTNTHRQHQHHTISN